MGRMRNSDGGSAHRAGPLKQENKKHKTGRHRSKGMLDVQTKGRVSSGPGSISKSQKGHSKRAERKKQAAVERMKKMAEVVEKKKSIGGARGAPICVALIPLGPTTSVDFMLKYIVANVKGFGTVVGQSENGSATHVKLSNGKNIMLVKPPSNDIWAVLDTLKQTDIALFLMPMLDELTPEGYTLLRTAKEQGLPTSFVGVSSSDFSKQEEKSWLKSVQKFLPAEKIYSITNPGQISNLLRMISVSKISLPKQWEVRASLFIESHKSYQALEPEKLPLHPNYVAAQGEESHKKLLEVTGVIRRKNLNPYRPLMISGVGAFQILRVDVTPMQVPEAFLSEEQKEQKQGEEEELPPRFLFDPLSVPQEEVDNSVNEVEDEEMGSDIDALDEEDFPSDDDDNQSQMSVDGGVEKKRKRLPKGTSEYQADWLMNSDGEADEDIVGSDEELENEEDEEDEEEDEDDEEMNWEEEKRHLQISKDAKTEAEFPDWVDTPLETPAKVRFQKYRGLQSFKKSAWDTNENLPKEYAKIFQFQNYKHVYKVVVAKGEVDGVGFIPVGQRVTMILKPLDELASNLGGNIGSAQLTSCVSLLRHETRMSVLNFQLNLTEVVKNKEELIFQVGYHRFQAKPVLSEISAGNKHKMLRFGQINQSCMATVFGPILFPPASVIAFKTCKSELIPVGSGHLFSIDPNRLVIKRVLLSGHPFKVTNKNAVVRFMFFNREDIDWFKPVELRTRYGRKGHIKEPLGTHGHMKCRFDGQMKSQDTVLMPLYKRVFPKWNYDPVVPTFAIFDSYQK